MESDAGSRLPLRPKTFHVLLALSDQARHGYGLKKSIRDRTSGTVDLDLGGLYRLIMRLEEDGLVERSAPPEGGANDPRRRYYTLTDRGREVLQAEARRLSDVMQWADVVALVKNEGPS